MEPPPNFDAKLASERTMQMAEELFPIHRTLVNKGFDDSLEIINQSLPLNIRSVASGTKLGNWTVPNAWNVNQAYIEDSKGNRLVDFDENNLHLAQYSVGLDTTISHKELFEHLEWIEHQPEAIPYTFLYYQRGWQFNIPYAWKNRFTSDTYRVVIDIDEKPGDLKVAEFVIPGTSGQEFLVSSYLCHPSLANDNLSGVLTIVEAFRQLRENLKTPRHTYRMIIIPETIGALAFMSLEPDLPQRALGALVVYDCGDQANLGYKRSYHENSLIDQIFELIADQGSEEIELRPWMPVGSDERQYNAPGFRMPAGSLTRSIPMNYPEYHTSLDTLDMISGEKLSEAAAKVVKAIEILESNRTYKNLYTGEPCFSAAKIPYPAYRKPDTTDRFINTYLASEIDGTKSLLEISKKTEFSYDKLVFAAEQFLKAGIIEELPQGG